MSANKDCQLRSESPGTDESGDFSEGPDDNANTSLLMPDPRLFFFLNNWKI